MCRWRGHHAVLVGPSRDTRTVLVNIGSWIAKEEFMVQVEATGDAYGHHCLRCGQFREHSFTANITEQEVKTALEEQGWKF